MKTYSDLVAAFAEKYAEEAYKTYGDDSSIAPALVKNFKSIFKSPEAKALVQEVARQAWTDGNNYQLSLEGRDRLAKGICPIKAWWQEFTKQKE